jgi:hypothetical protein
MPTSWLGLVVEKTSCIRPQASGSSRVRHLRFVSLNGPALGAGFKLCVPFTLNVNPLCDYHKYGRGTVSPPPVILCMTIIQTQTSLVLYIHAALRFKGYLLLFDSTSQVNGREKQGHPASIRVPHILPLNLLQTWRLEDLPIGY